MSKFTVVLNEGEIEVGAMRAVDLDGYRVLVSRSEDGEVCAIANTCTHRGGPLNEGERDGNVVAYPWHGSQFDLCSGEVLRGPARAPTTLRGPPSRREDRGTLTVAAHFAEKPYQKGEEAMVYELPQLPLGYDALEPYIDEETMHLHHEKHHNTYISNRNVALEKHPEADPGNVDELLAGIDPVPEDIRRADRITVAATPTTRCSGRSWPQVVGVESWSLRETWRKP